MYGESVGKITDKNSRNLSLTLRDTEEVVEIPLAEYKAYDLSVVSGILSEISGEGDLSGSSKEIPPISVLEDLLGLYNQTHNCDYQIKMSYVDAANLVTHVLIMDDRKTYTIPVKPHSVDSSVHEDVKVSKVNAGLKSVF